MTTHPLLHASIHPSWHECLQRGLARMDASYLQALLQSNDWLPGKDKVFNAFTLPIQDVRYILFGESPYPRARSANGYAFWDNDVNALWSDTGLDKKVNRATSLRNIIKMLLIADGKLTPDNTTQQAIAALDKSIYVQTNADFFHNFLDQGFLLLNATPVLQAHQPPQKDAKAWQPFLQEVLHYIVEHQPQAKLILLGNIAKAIDPLLPKHPIQKLYAEHPYNLSFVANPEVIEFFSHLSLLKQNQSIL